MYGLAPSVSTRFQKRNESHRHRRDALLVQGVSNGVLPLKRADRSCKTQHHVINNEVPIHEINNGNMVCMLHEKRGKVTSTRQVDPGLEPI